MAWLCYQCDMAKSARWLVGAVAVLTIVIGLVGGVATSALPSSWKPHLWLAWPITLVLGLILVILQVRQQNTDSLPAAQPAGANARSLLLESVHKIWIAGVLERSLYHEAHIELGLTTTADTPDPWDLISAEPAGKPTPVPPGTPPHAVFRELQQRMLILGSPGSGKTTTMLELLRGLLAEAQRDANAPVPVFLPLASWSRRCLDLEQWVLSEVNVRYDVQPGHVRAWLDSSQLLLLLDGLDEVEAEKQQQCVEKINQFRSEHGTTPIAICCRTLDYQRLHSALNVYGTLTVESLNRDEVERLLDRPDGLFAGVQDALSRQPWLWELADSPLYLSFMMLSFGDQDNGAIPQESANSEQEGRSLLIANYVRTMLRHRHDPKPAQTLRGLAFVARQMQRTNQTVFTSDLLGSDSEPSTWWYRLLSVTNRAILEIISAVMMGAIAAAFYGWRGAIAGTIAGLCSFFEEYTDSINLSSGPPALLSSDRFRWRRVRKEYPMAFDSIDSAMRPIVALSIIDGLIFGLSTGTIRALVKDIFIYAVAILLAGLIVILLARLCGRILADVRPDDFAHDFPSPRLQVVLRSSAEVVLVGALIAGTAAGLLVASISTAANGLHFGVVIASCAAIYLYKSLAGFALIEQARIRFALRRAKLLPMSSRQFFAHAVQCLFMQETGDGYMFRHIFIQEFFSELCPPEKPWHAQNQPDSSRINEILANAGR